MMYSIMLLLAMKNTIVGWKNWYKIVPDKHQRPKVEGKKKYEFLYINFQKKLLKEKALFSMMDDDRIFIIKTDII